MPTPLAYSLLAPAASGGASSSTATVPPAVSGPAATFGVDIDAIDDLDPHMNLVAGTTNLLHAIARRLGVARGSMPYDADYGFDLRTLLGESFTQKSVFDMARSVEAECEKDPRVFRAHVDLTADPIGSSLLTTVQLETAAGPFPLVLAVTAVTVQLLTPS